MEKSRIFPCQSIHQLDSSLSLRSHEKFIFLTILLWNKFAYNRPWPTEVACNWNEILRNWLRSTSPRFFLLASSHRVLLTKNKQSNGSFSATVHLHQIISFACALLFTRPRGIAMRCKGERISYYFNFFKLFFFAGFFQLFIDWIYLFFVYLIILLRAYFAYQRNRSFLSILLHFDLNKLPIEWNEARCLLLQFLACLFFLVFFSIPRYL